MRSNYSEYKQCTKCVMDTSAIEIIFDENGVCNFCQEFEQKKPKNYQNEEYFKEIINEIKISGKGKKYDCIIGVSGGVDSTYVAYLAKKQGLRGLLVHLDNGWNSELSVSNIEKIINYTGFDLYTLVLDWEEFKDMQRSFFEADVLDLELLSDHAIFATVFKLCKKYGVRYLLSGENYSTEAIMPTSWVWNKSDSKNIRNIHKKFGRKKIKTFPLMSIQSRYFYEIIGLAKSIPILNFIEYNKSVAMDTIQSEMGWKYYGGKHYESIFTRFYQGYILPVKFNIDKRKAHLSTLINNGEISREDAEDILKEPTYAKDLKQEDFKLVCKKLEMSEKDMNNYLQRPEIKHIAYSQKSLVYKALRKAYRRFKNV